MKRIKILLVIIVIGGAVLSLQCISNSKEKIEINIGYQSITAQTWGALIIKNQHLLEKKLKQYYPNISIEVNWYDEVSGSIINNNMIAHKYQIGYMGDMACILNLFYGDKERNYNSELVAFDGKGIRGKNQNIMVNLESEIKSLKDLVGKTISVPIGSSAHRMLLEILKKNNLLESVNIVYQDIPTACNMVVTEKVDAMAAWEPYPSAMQYENKMTELVSGVETGNDYLAGIVVDSDWIESHKHIFEIFMECIEESHDYINKHPDESIEIICNESNFSSEVVTKVLGSIEWESTILSKDMKTLKEDCDFLVATKKIDEFPISKYIRN